MPTRDVWTEAIIREITMTSPRFVDPIHDWTTQYVNKELAHDFANTPVSAVVRGRVDSVLRRASVMS